MHLQLALARPGHQKYVVGRLLTCAGVSSLRTRHSCDHDNENCQMLMQMVVAPHLAYRKVHAAYQIRWLGHADWKTMMVVTQAFPIRMSHALHCLLL